MKNSNDDKLDRLGGEPWDSWLLTKTTAKRCECTLYDGHRCTKSARYIIDDINLCTQHAGPIAIIKLIASGEAEKIKVTNKYSKDPLCNLVSIYDK